MRGSIMKEEKKVIKRKKKASWNFLVKRILIAILLFALIGATGIFAVIHSKLYKDLSSTAYDKLAAMSNSDFRMYANTQVYDKNNAVIGEIDTGNYEYEYKEIAEIPLALQNAYIAAEDRNFKVHHGVDIKGIARAGIALIKNKGEITQGGSTITQQVIKNSLLTQEQSFKRKLLEILIAPEMEKKYSKQQIMEFYCNSNYYGNGCYGVGSAAKFYFGKDVSELSTAECAMIAAISNSPNNFNPVADEKLAKEKMHIVLDQMYEHEFISESVYKTASAQEITVTQTMDEITNINNYMCSYAIHCSVLELMKQDGFVFQYTFPDQAAEEAYSDTFQKSYSESFSEIYAGGYKIYTSFDQDLQKSLQESFDNELVADQGVQENGKYNLQGAGVCIDNETGYVVAMVGGRGANDQFNRGFLAKRQPGSTIKPILDYGPAFDAGKAYPSSIYTDKKTTAANGFAPENAGKTYQGNMSLRRALAQSTNTIALQLFEQVGQENAMNYLRQMNFDSLSYADNTAPPISLGGFTYGVSVVDMAKAYHTLENGGTYLDQNCITKMEHEKDGVLYDGKDVEKRQVYSSDTAFMLTDMMQGVFLEKDGTAYGTDVNGHIIAGKTGTTNEDRDSWLCGYSKYYTLSVWTGYDDNSPLSNTNYTKNIWQDFMKKAHDGKEVKDFTRPDTIEYRNITGNGTLGSKVYSKLDTSKRTYYQRSSGYDLYSTKKSEEANDFQKKLKRKEEVENAETAVKVFEAYEVKDVKTARGLGDAYNKVLAEVEKVSDAEKHSQFKSRIATKMKKLERTKKKWEKQIAEAEEEETKILAAEQSAKDEENSLKVTEALKETRIANMQKYLNLLSQRQFNTDTAQSLIMDASKCLENLSKYDEYDSFQDQLEEEIERISKLPTEVPQPEIPENENDITPDGGNYPPEEVPEKPERAE